MHNRVEYSSTLAEIAELHFRVQERSKLIRRTRRQSAFWSAVITGIVVFLMLTALGAALGERFAFAGVAAAATAAGAWLYFPRSARRRILKYLRERMHSDQPVRFTVELRDDCIWTKQGGTQLSFDWGNVADILNSADAVEFRMHDGGWMFVRDKGFPTPESRLEFVEEATRKMREAQSS